MLKSPADPDTDVEKNTVDPSCPPKKSSTWGQVWGNPILLRNDPGEQGKTSALTPTPGRSRRLTQPAWREPQTPAQPGTTAVSTPHGQILPGSAGSLSVIEYVKSGRIF
jgi:hypothetical protein